MTQDPSCADSYSKRFPDAVYNEGQRQQKARKILAVLSDFLSRPLDGLRVLDLGCATGIIANSMAPQFRTMIGTDIDMAALAFANSTKGANALFLPADALHIPFRDEAVDIVICAHVYEHVRDPKKLMREIWRVLQNKGVCFFSAGNGLQWIEPHYGLPLLSVLPRFLAHVYLRLLRRGLHYDEKHLTYWGLLRLVSNFQVFDYTTRIIQNPEKYSATELCSSGSLRQKFALLLCRLAYGLVPTYIFLLKKTKP
jgi:2-polyprenyl-3-methyl-5-hydroxy-6-metoxy-1,4-benzoquinol methylase